METPNEAFEFTMDKVLDLKCEENIISEIKVIRKSSSQDSYDKETGIPPARWVNVIFHVKNKEQAEKVLEMANYLLLCGISFDSGGCKNCRQWELDWSFRYKKGEHNGDLKEARNQVEDELQSLM